MLDLERLRDLQVSGTQSMQTLTEQEQDLMIGYFSLASKDVMKAAQTNKMSTSLAMINAFQFGFGLGLRLKLENGEVKER
jgi:uncharacterized membrane protein